MFDKLKGIHQLNSTACEYLPFGTEEQREAIASVSATRPSAPSESA